VQNVHSSNLLVSLQISLFYRLKWCFRAEKTQGTNTNRTYQDFYFQENEIEYEKAWWIINIWALELLAAAEQCLHTRE
jgi:hypothetical protein